MIWLKFTKMESGYQYVGIGSGITIRGQHYFVSNLAIQLVLSNKSQLHGKSLYPTMVLELENVKQMIFGANVLVVAMITLLVVLIAVTVGLELWLVLELNAQMVMVMVI
jgi:hypothetical protein